MKKQQRKLQLISRFIDLDMFYKIGFDKGEIKLQGSYNKETSKELSKHFDFRIEKETGFIEADRNGINVCLT